MPDELPFDPSLPHAIALPWGGQWAAVQVVYDLYKCEAYFDEEPTILAPTAEAGRKIAAQRRELARRRDLLLASALAADAEVDAAAKEGRPGPDPVAAAQAQSQRRIALDEWADAHEACETTYRAWRRTRATDQARFFVIRVEWPDGSSSPGAEAATWRLFPADLMTWVANDGFEAARNALWHHPAAPDPKAPDPPPSTPTATP